MLKNRKRKIVVALTAAMLLGSVCVGNVSAGSTVSGYLNITNSPSCYGSVNVSYPSSKATSSAYTSCSSYAGLYAQAELRVKVGNTSEPIFRTEQNSGYNLTAVAKSTTAQLPVSAYGRHNVTYNGYSWGEKTTYISYK